MKSVLVLGATGFIGGQIALAALDKGWQVRGLRRDPSAVGVLNNKPVEWHTGDLSDLDNLVAAMRGVEVVFHAAGYYPWKTRDIRKPMREAGQQIRNVLDAARAADVRRVIYTGSLTTVAPSPDPERLSDERDFYQPGTVDSSYFECKWVMESECYRAAAEGLSVVVLIPTVVFGPGDVKPTTGRLLVEMAKGRMPVAVDAPFNVIDGRDVAAAHIAAAEHPDPALRYVLGAHNSTIADTFRLAAQLTGRRAPTVLSVGLVRVILRTADALHLPLVETVRTMLLYVHVDSSLAQRDLGLNTLRPLAETLQDTLDWFHENGYL